MTWGIGVNITELPLFSVPIEGGSLPFLSFPDANISRCSTKINEFCGELASVGEILSEGTLQPRQTFTSFGNEIIWPGEPPDDATYQCISSLRGIVEERITLERWFSAPNFVWTNQLGDKKIPVENDIAILGMDPSTPSSPIIHRIWLGEYFPHRLRIIHEEWERLYPDRVKLWRDADIERLLPSFSPWMNQLGVRQHDPRLRSDLLRLEILHRFGGWYTDMDVVPCKLLPQLAPSHLVAVLEDPSVVSNAILGVGMPRFKLLTRIMENVRRWAQYFSGEETSSITGPRLVTRAVREFSAEVILLPVSFAHPRHFSEKRNARTSCDTLPEETVLNHLFDSERKSFNPTKLQLVEILPNIDEEELVVILNVLPWLGVRLEIMGRPWHVCAQGRWRDSTPRCVPFLMERVVQSVSITITLSSQQLAWDQMRGGESGPAHVVRVRAWVIDSNLAPLPKSSVFGAFAFASQFLMSENDVDL